MLFSGSHEPNELPDYWSDYLINTRTLRVSYWDEESARELIVEPVKDFPDICDCAKRSAIMRSHRRRCHYPPHSLPALSRPVNLLRGSRTALSDIRENRRDVNTPKATAQDVQTVIPTVLERGGEYFQQLWESLTDRDRILLRRLVQAETPAAPDKAVLRKLERKEILEKTESGYGF